MIVILITSLLLVYLDFPADSWVLVGEIARRPFGHPTTVALVLATLPGLPMPEFDHSARLIFYFVDRWMTAPVVVPIAADCSPGRIGSAAAGSAAVCHSAGSIDFASADFVVAAVSAATVVATDFARTAVVVASDSVPNSVAIVGFAGTAAGSVV